MQLGKNIYNLLKIRSQKMVGVLYKTSKLITLNVYKAFTSPLYTPALTMQISHGLALIILNWKKLFGKQKQAVRIIFNQNRFTHARPLLKTLNTLNIHQINLLRVLLFMLKIKTNSSPRIFRHRFQAVNHKYTTRYSRNDFKEPKRERLIMPNIAFMRSVRFFGTAF